MASDHLWKPQRAAAETVHVWVQVGVAAGRDTAGRVAVREGKVDEQAVRVGGKVGGRRVSKGCGTKRPG